MFNQQPSSKLKKCTEMRKWMLFVMVLFITLDGWALSFTVDNINYATIGSNAVEVVSGDYSGAIIIPSSVVYSNVTYTVLEFGIDAFKNCTGITSIEIPSTIRRFKSAAFYGCSGLTTITIPSSVTIISDFAFAGCSGLTSITIPSSVTSIGSEAFAYCSGLTSITIPSSVTRIGTAAFAYCSGLTSITIPSSVTIISDFAFDHCSALTSITIPPSVAIIGSAAFQACIGLTSIAIPPLVSSIRDYTFSGCNNLISIEFPPALESIGDYAFYNCISLSSIKTGTTTPPGLSVDVFYLVDKTKCLLYVPIGSLSAYKEADQWKDFLTILEFDPAGISKVNCPIITIYPNPTQTHVTIELGEASINARLILYNSLGQTVYECQTANERMSLDVSRFPAGKYIVKVKGDNKKQWVGKFIKE